MVSYISGRWWRWKFWNVLWVTLFLTCTMRTAVLSCQVECDVTLTSPSGIFTSPCYPSDYPASLTCKWTLQAPAGFVLQLTFLDFELEEAQGCIYDSVVVDTGASNVRFCGLTANRLTLNSSTNVMLVSFSSDFSIQKKGFSISYRQVAVALRNQKVTLPQNTKDVVRVSSLVSIPVLSQFTVCFEIAGQSHTGSWIIFSYTSKEPYLSFGNSGNTMELSFGNVTCPVNDVVTVADFTANMQPFCVTWSNVNGAVAVYFKGNYHVKYCSESVGMRTETGGSFELGRGKKQGQNFNGILYNFRVWNTAMTSSELSALTCDAVGNVVDWDNGFWEIPASYAQTDSTLSCICYPQCAHLTTTLSSTGTALPATTSQTTSCVSPGAGCPASLTTTTSSIVNTNTISTNATSNDLSINIFYTSTPSVTLTAPAEKGTAVLFWSLLRLPPRSAAVSSTPPPSQPPVAPAGRSSKTSLGFISTPLIWPVRKKPEIAVTQAPKNPTLHITKAPPLPTKSMTSMSPEPRIPGALTNAKKTNFTTRRPAYSHVMGPRNQTKNAESFLVVSVSNRKTKPLTPQWDLSESNENSSEELDFPSGYGSESFLYDIDLDEDIFSLFEFDAPYSLEEGLSATSLNVSLLKVANAPTGTDNTPIEQVETQNTMMLIKALGGSDVQTDQSGPSRLTVRTTEFPSLSRLAISPIYSILTSTVHKVFQGTQCIFADVTGYQQGCTKVSPLLQPTVIAQGQLGVLEEHYGRTVMPENTPSIAASLRYSSNYITGLFTEPLTVSKYQISYPLRTELHPTLYISPMPAIEGEHEYTIRPSPLSTVSLSSAPSFDTSESFLASGGDLDHPQSENLFILNQSPHYYNNFESLRTPSIVASYPVTEGTIAASLVEGLRGLEPSHVSRPLDPLYSHKASPHAFHSFISGSSATPILTDQWISSAFSPLHSSLEMETQKEDGLRMYTQTSGIYVDHSFMTSPIFLDTLKATEGGGMFEIRGDEVLTSPSLSQTVPLEFQSGPSVPQNVNNTDGSKEYYITEHTGTSTLNILRSKLPNKDPSLSCSVSTMTSGLTPDVPQLPNTENDQKLDFSHVTIGFPHTSTIPSIHSLMLEESVHSLGLDIHPVDTSIVIEDLQDTQHAQFSTTEQLFWSKNESAKPSSNKDNAFIVLPITTDREMHPSPPAVYDQSFVSTNGTFPLASPPKGITADFDSVPTDATHGPAADSTDIILCPCKAVFYTSCHCGLSTGNKFTYFRISLIVSDKLQVTDDSIARWLNQTFQDWNHTIYVNNVSILPGTDSSITQGMRYSCKALLVYRNTTGKLLTDADITNRLKSISPSATFALDDIAVNAIENCPAEETPLHYKWPETRTSVTHFIPCFPYKEQNASRTCMISPDNYSSFWDQPDLLNCTNIEDIKVSQENAADVAVQLADITNNELSTDELSKVVTVVTKLVNVARINVSLASTVVTIISNVMISSEPVQLAASDMALKTMDKLVQKIEFDGPSLTITSKNLAVGISAINSSSFSGANFSAFMATNSSDPQIDFESDISNSLARVSLPASLLHNMSDADIELVSRINFMFFSKTGLFQYFGSVMDQQNNGLSLNSYVVASSVGNFSISNLKDPVQIEISHLQHQWNLNRLCVFWDFSIENGTGGWNSEGCKVSPESNSNRTICLCNHLTHFGVLMDLSGASAHINERNSKILMFITYIGCGISAIFSAVTILTYVAFEKLRRDYPSKILMNLSTSLLFLNMMFLLDGWLASYDMEGLCIAAAAFLHFFLLTSFTWMGLESVHMYIALVKVFNTYIRRYILKFCIVGWGLPAVIVALVLAINKNSYTNEFYGSAENGKFCWIGNKYVFYVTCVAYFCAIFLLNVAMFIVVMMQICGRNGKRNNRTLQEEVLRNLRSVISLTFLLGMTWGFAFFAWGPVNLAFMYLFTIFNSLQGLFIFVFHCALKENVQKQWRRYLCCGKLRLPDNSDWSKTATNNTKKVSSDNIGKSLSSSSYGSSTANWTSKARVTLNPFAKRHSSSGKPYSIPVSQKCSTSDLDASSSSSSILPVHQVLDKVKGYCSVRSDNFYKNIILSDSFSNSTKF
ncbi:adhesion G-protein coupled receptor G6 isoform X1 [Silurus meridionalis]|uniref:adhesion G-protein coupled receptor G6 isoform X1 n=1 Tax=Silurus meridionalis TaxID=175797 RepID=UPI001EE9E498|nr:adhesion G-protein coupled receptor G6 isoform X1 [Silurus meridionalis]